LHTKANLISTSAGILCGSKRYIIWFYLLNLGFACLGASPFSASTHGILDHSLYADRLLHGFDLGVLAEMIARPEFGPVRRSAMPGVSFAFLFFLVSILFMPGVLLGYSSDHRIARAEFFRACGRNLWRFVRLLVIFVLIAGVVVGVLSAVQAAAVNAVDQSSNDDRLPFVVECGTLGLTLLVLTLVRLWFDLAQTDVVLRDQGAIRKSVRWALRATRRNFFRLLGAYLLAAVVATLILLTGILLWHAVVPPSSVLGAFVISQATLFLLLSSRFWQRAIAVAFYVRHSTERDIEFSSSDLALSAIP
jgi:membrane-anchored glycerophosphoryl diester phosphodiesterase (GDPDase)